MFYSEICVTIFLIFGGYMKKTEKNFGRAVVALFTSALCFGFASCNFGDGDNNSTSDTPPQNEYGVVKEVKVNKSGYLEGATIEMTDFGIKMYDNEGRLYDNPTLISTTTYIPDIINVKIGIDAENLREVTFGHTVYQESDSLISISVKESKTENGGKTGSISIIKLNEINSIATSYINIYQNTDVITPNLLALKKDGENIAMIPFLEGNTVADGITVYIDKNYGIGEDVETHEYIDYSAGTDLTDVINAMKNDAKNDITLSSNKSHRYSFYIKFMELTSKERKIYVNKTEKNF